MCRQLAECLITGLHAASTLGWMPRRCLLPLPWPPTLLPAPAPRLDTVAVEQVLDPRTRMVLFKMLNRGVFSEINGALGRAGPPHAAPTGAPGLLVMQTHAPSQAGCQSLLTCARRHPALTCILNRSFQAA